MISITEKKKSIWPLCVALVLAGCFFLTTTSFGQEIPAPGTVIDKNNYKKYSHLFPTEWAPIFEDGYGGLFIPQVYKVTSTKSYPMSKTFLAMSQKNKGKVVLDPATGNVSSSWDRNGFPFPDLDKSDKDFVTKLMWNYDSRYQWDDCIQAGLGYTKRRGQAGSRTVSTNYQVSYVSRLVESPKPFMESPVKAMSTIYIDMVYPEAFARFGTMSTRYLDPTKSDDTYLYLPTMRRVLRGEAGQRSTPVTGTSNSLDDFSIFSGRIPEFTFKFVGEQKVLMCMDSKMTFSYEKKNGFKCATLPHVQDDYEVRDTYVVDIFPKNPKYPQSKKRIWLDKETMSALYGISWDKAGKVWKVWAMPLQVKRLPDGGVFTVIGNLASVDVQFGLGTNTAFDNMTNSKGLSWADVSPAAMLKKGR